jgi:RNA polymerase sigma factor (sigma-70 family)
LRNQSGAAAAKPAPGPHPKGANPHPEGANPHPEGAGPHPEGGEAREVAARLRIGPGRLKNLDRAMIERSSYYGIGDDGDLTSLEEIIADPRRPNCDLEAVEDLQVMHEALDRLPPFEAWVIRQRFGLHGLDRPGAPPQACESSPRPRSYYQISRACGLTIKRVRRAEEQALFKLREQLQEQFAEAG